MAQQRVAEAHSSLGLSRNMLQPSVTDVRGSWFWQQADLGVQCTRTEQDSAKQLNFLKYVTVNGVESIPNLHSLKRNLLVK